ncbi:helix-turn-helix domain-containing protein [Actinomadura sp. 3N407]|uniref:helix-turn-helix domain-containing protein n=1 Tax=Actinomadura sp. 3N407 TaxID=3457423 RepID=UPI003FCD9EFF
MAAEAPQLPSSSPIPIDRTVLSVLALVDLTGNGYRVLLQLLAHQDPDTGVANISQKEVSEALGIASPNVNKAFKDLAAAGLITPGYGRYQLHPLLTGGRTGAAVAEVPTITALDPEAFNAVRRARYRQHLANLGMSA